MKSGPASEPMGRRNGIQPIGSTDRRGGAFGCLDAQPHGQKWLRPPCLRRLLEKRQCARS